MGAAIKYIFLLVMVAVLSGCPPKNECDQKTKVLPLAGQYKVWFSACTTNNSLPIQSVKGLTESLNESVFKYKNTLGRQPDYCVTYMREFNSLSYYSLYYYFTLNFSLMSDIDGPYFVCKIKGKYNNFNNAEAILKKNMLTGENKKIEVSYFSTSYTDSLTSYSSKIEVIDSLVTTNKVYYNVYKITNDLYKYHGDNFSIVEAYIDQNAGLLRFKQKNGDQWDVK